MGERMDAHQTAAPRSQPAARSRPVAPPPAAADVLAAAGNAGVARVATGAAVLQRKLPPEQWDTMGFYNARIQASADEYTSGRPAKFSTTFKTKLLQHWGTVHNIIEGEGLRVQRGGGGATWVPFAAFQIDHHTSWDDIEVKLRATAAQLATRIPAKHEPAGFSADAYKPKVGGKVVPWADWPGTGTVVPTEYGARMYFHDVENLKPMLGSENASKGAGGAIGGPATGAASLAAPDTHVIGVEIPLQRQFTRVLTQWRRINASQRNESTAIQVLDTLESGLEEAADHLATL